MADSNSMQRFTFSKEERLSKKKLIDELFESGSSFHLPPLRVLMLEKKAATAETKASVSQADLPTASTQILITVSSKHFSRAVDRNRVKRLLRESYRLHKHLLYEKLVQKKKKLLLAFLYTSKKIEPFAVIEEKVVASLHKIISHL